MLTFINVTGISIGFVVALIIGLWVHHELTFNSYHKNYSRIALVTSSYDYNGDRISLSYSPHLMADEIRTSYPENFAQVVMSTFTAKYVLSVGEKKFNITGNFMEPGAVDMLGLQLTGGTKDGLGEPGAILLAESAARMFFGNTDPVGKLLKIDNRDVMNVIGTYADIPKNSDFRDLLFVAPWKQYLSAHPEIEENPQPWMSNSFQTFVLLADGMDMSSASAMLRDIRREKLTAEEAQTLDPSVFLYPMFRWHLYAASDDGQQRQEKIENIWLVGSIGVFVLMLACINYINLSTARSEKKAAEVGVRKTVGSNRIQLVYQFFIESLLTITVAFILCIFLTAVALPGFNEMMGLRLSVLWDSPSFWLAGGGVVIVTSIVSGFFPALYLSSFQPVKVLKGTFRVGRFSIALRKSLVVMQFAVSVFLIVCTIVVHRQIQYTQDRPVGYSKEGLLSIRMSPSIEKSFETMRNELKASNTIVEMAASVNTTTEFNTGDVNVSWKGRDHSKVAGFAVSNVTHGYGETIGWRIKEGRDFSKDYPTDSSGVIINVVRPSTEALGLFILASQPAQL